VGTLLSCGYPSGHSADRTAVAYDAVLFDFFGTLTTAIQRGPAHDVIARVLGCEPARFAAALNRTFRDRASGSGEPAVQTLSRLAREQGAFPGDHRLRWAVRARVHAVAADVRLRADAVPVLLAVRRLGLRVATVSDCWYELPAFFSQLAIAPLVDARIFSVDIGCCKPDPGIYRAACRALGIAEQRCLYIGDGGGRELSGARDVGMTAVRLAADDLGGHLTFDAESRWDGQVVAHLTDLLPLLVRTLEPV
jgi:putative hydrolase of the HAD superfamily